MKWLKPLNVSNYFYLYFCKNHVRQIFKNYNTTLCLS